MFLGLLDEAYRPGGGAVAWKPAGQPACLLDLTNLESLLQQIVDQEKERGSRGTEDNHYKHVCVRQQFEPSTKKFNLNFIQD